MEIKTDCYVAGAMAALLRMSRLGGIAPLKFEKQGSGWRVSFSPGWSYYGYIIITIFVALSIATLIADFELQQGNSVRLGNKTNTFYVANIVDLAWLLLVAATSVLRAPAQMRAMIACLNRVETIKFEADIRQSPMFCEKKNTYIFYIWATVVGALLIMDKITMVIGNIPKSHFQIFVSSMYSIYYCYCWILQLRMINFIMITLHVMYCLRSINEGLKTLLREPTDGNEWFLMTPFNHNFCKVTKKKASKSTTNKIADSENAYSDGAQKSRRHHETVRRLALAYANTCDVVRDVDSAHGMIVLMMLGSSLLLLVCTPYYLITSTFNNENSEMHWTAYLTFVGMQMLWIFFHAANLLIIIEPCHMTYMEMEATCELVSHLMRCTDSIYDPLAMELNMFFKHLFLNQASYSAMHVTTISRSLLATIIGSITTYLVIMIQL